MHAKGNSPSYGTLALRYAWFLLACCHFICFFHALVKPAHFSKSFFQTKWNSLNIIQNIRASKNSQLMLLVPDSREPDNTVMEKLKPNALKRNKTNCMEYHLRLCIIRLECFKSYRAMHMWMPVCVCVC